MQSNFVLWILSELPFAIYGGSLIQFEGLPTFIGGYNQDIGDFSEVIYQYHWNENKWVERKTLAFEELRMFSATFEVPRDIFGMC
jgi:hypothetical protein